MQGPIWQERRDFGNGERLYRCLDICTHLGSSVLEFYSDRLAKWRRVNNVDVREAMHRYTAENYRDPF